MLEQNILKSVYNHQHRPVGANPPNQLWKNIYYEWEVCCHFRGFNVGISRDSERQNLPDLSVFSSFLSFAFLRRPLILLVNSTLLKTRQYINIVHFIQHAVNNINIEDKLPSVKHEHPEILKSK